MSQTRHISLDDRGNQEIKEILLVTYKALEAKGYKPIDQIVGYILSGDPTYITTYDNARNRISKVDRYDLLKLLLTDFLSGS